MPNPTSQKRLTETFAGRAAALLLAVIWLASMGMTDINAYSYFPTMAGLIVVVLLALSAMIRGARTVQLSWLAWCSLAIGGYFLARCLCSFDVVSSWREAGLILSCGVFYVAGIYAAQGRSLKPTIGVLLVAVVLHIIYFLLMKYTALPLEWTGRPSFGPGGANHRPVTLFVYKNQAGAFLMISGMLLAAAALWAGGAKRLRTLVLAFVGVGAVALSGCCGTRAVLLLGPVLLFLGWLLWVVVKLNTEDHVSLGIVLSCFLILVAIVAGACVVIFDHDLSTWLMSVNSHNRYAIWKTCCQLISNVPLRGYGADSVPWLFVPIYAGGGNLINFAHNEYLQAWVDYGPIGIGGMLFVLSAHTVRGGLVLISARTSVAQHRLAALALLCIFGWAVASFVDFYWHHVPVASMTAFCVGILASPYPHERRGLVHRVRAQGAAGKGILAFLTCGFIACSSWLCSLYAPVWVKQWEFNRLAVPGADDSGEQRLSIINSLLPQYPSHRLIDTAYRLPCGASWPEAETMLLRVLKANPRQLFMVGMLGNLYTEQGRYKEAEKLYRRYYLGDGMSRLANAQWPYFYYCNLMDWAHISMLTGDMPGAYSRMRYALEIYEVEKLCYIGYSTYPRPAEEWMNRQNYIRARKQDIKLFETLGIQPDDSWMEPMEPGGKPALYRRYGLPDAAEREKVAEQERYSWRLLRQNP